MPVKTVTKLVVVLKLITCYQAAYFGRDSEETTTDGHCPPWYFPDGEGECSFSHKLPQILHQLNDTSELQIGFCMTVANTSQVLAPCPYSPRNNDNFSQYHSIYQVLPTSLEEVNDSMCGPFNRRGFLCSECREGYGLAADRYYGFLCVKCDSSPWKWISYILLLFIPQTILFLIFLLLRINVHSGSLTGFIYFAHTIMTSIFFVPSLISLSQRLFGYWPMQIILTLYGVWNLNFMQFVTPPFCVSPHLTILQLVSLGYVSSAYPLILCIVTYYLIQLHAGGNRLFVRLWRPFQRFFSKFPSDIESSVVHTFGTFILLSYGKNVFVSFTLIQSSYVVSLDAITNTLRLLPSCSVDLGAPYFGSTHAPYGALGILGGIVTVILPLILVSLYPTRIFPRLIAYCGLRRWHAIRSFMEVFVGSYKDGSDVRVSKRDYRFMASLYLIGRVVLGLAWVKRGTNGQTVQYYFLLITAVPYIIVATVFAFVKPHRKLWHNVVDVLLFLLIAKISICLHVMFETALSDHTLRIIVLILLIDLAIPHVILIIFFSYKLACWIYSKWSTCSCAQGRNTLGEGEHQDRNGESQPLLVPA